MLHIEIETIWRFRKEDSPQTIVVMLGVLNEIRKTGKITDAANHVQLSYRHVWNLLEQWSEFFGVPLVETHRGKGTALTEFGEKLVWAGQRTQARLGPQLENLAQAACGLSGVHLPRGELRQQNIDACKQWLDPREYRVISFVTREMGLIVKRGNPLAITSLKDIAARKARFVNRDHDSGTRLLFDQLLAQDKIDGTRINGLKQIEFTHAAVAAYVASDMADVSFGVEAAARQFGLDFIRLLTEDYFFVCRQNFLETEPMRRVLDIMKGREFQEAVAALPGYKATHTGVVHTVREFLDRV